MDAAEKQIWTSCFHCSRSPFPLLRLVPSETGARFDRDDSCRGSVEPFAAGKDAPSRITGSSTTLLQKGVHLKAIEFCNQALTLCVCAAGLDVFETDGKATRHRPGDGNKTYGRSRLMAVASEQKRDMCLQKRIFSKADSIHSVRPMFRRESRYTEEYRNGRAQPHVRP